ncbi:MAG: sigma-54 dependent transcriptional regulator [candidate division WOR-3 bacterium]|uniref:Sigma-54-dependent Fis family transcriptional regulator n=1 Tax=candidate division WOR-3 bacterium TaxID=2052148 RepID=A0A7C1WY56_UNCW3|nr:sigma-54 dependent transcriptional regulator [candidate division WOR-3 bacterium]
MRRDYEAVILVVDDNAETLEVLERNLNAAGYQVWTAQNVTDAVKLLQNEHFDVVITDMKMPGASGLDLIKYVRENLNDTEVMVITGYATVESAVQAVKIGAEEYLPKPFTDEELLNAVKRVLEKLRMRRAADASKITIQKVYPGLLGESPAMKKVFNAIERAAQVSATVLITGESGTGKELVARAIHYASKRASAPFVPVNCGGIPESLLESELFGYVKGAFTGATETRAGFFQTAEGGSIFLDEISETSPSMQVKLLRVLQDKEVRMLGDSRVYRVDVRVMAATNKDLLALVQKGAFREDLFFRLNVLNISVPPLRERGEDIFLLARYFLEKFAREMGRSVPHFTDQALDAFRRYEWPGNVRELENLIQRLLVMVDGDKIDITDLPSHMRFSVAAKIDLTRTLKEVESEYILQVLKSVGGNLTRAASILGIDRKTLRNKLKESKPE